MVGLAPRERVQQRTADAPMPQVLEETVEAVRVVQRERMQQQTVFAPTPQSPEETVEMVRSVSHEHLQQRAAEQIEDAPQSLEETVEAVTLVPREQAQQRTSFTDQGMQLLHSLRNMGRERAMRRVEKLRERHDLSNSRTFSSHRQSSTGSVVVTATCATSPLSQITYKTETSPG